MTTLCISRITETNFFYTLSRSRFYTSFDGSAVFPTAHTVCPEAFLWFSQTRNKRRRGLIIYFMIHGAPQCGYVSARLHQCKH